MYMKIRALIVAIVLFATSSSFAQSVGNLNSIFSKYSSSITVSNPENQKNSSCIYKTNYLRAELCGNYLILSFGFAWDENDHTYIDTEILKINLKTAQFYTGFWSKSPFGGQWQHNGDMSILQIKDETNGMDIAITGRQKWNKGTKNLLIEELRFSFGSAPLANRVLNEIYAIQASFKEKEPWLRLEEPKKSTETPQTSRPQAKPQSKPQAKPKPQPQQQPESTLPIKVTPHKPDRSM